MQQVIIIHGGTTFSNYEKYLDYLRTKSVQIDRLTYAPMWKERLQAKLGDNYQILLPSMPNATNAQYREWKLWFDRISEICTDDCILMGHSLGGVFLAKYLSENKFPKNIKATILIAAPFDDETEEDLADFKITEMSELFQKQAGSVILFNGNDDPVIPISEAEKYQAALPNAQIRIVSAPDHFVRSDFPELIDILDKL